MEDTVENKSHILINIFIIIIVIFIGLYLYARYYEHSKMIMKEYRITSKVLPKNFDGIKIVHISDLYFGNTTDIKEVNLLVNKINEMKPDLILFTGNVYGNKIKKEDKLKEELLNLKSNLGKYAVKGNNDYYDEYSDFMKDIDFIVINNNYELIYKDTETPIFLCGLNSSLKEEVNLSECINYFKENENLDYYKIYMIHESDNIKKITNDASPDLLLTGNSLGGCINIPFYGSLIKPNGSKKYMEEYYKIKNSEVFVSTGIGTDLYPYRFLNNPSFNLYRLKYEE